MRPPHDARAVRPATAAAATAAAAVLAVIARLVLAGDPLKPDEAGYLLVARTAHPGGPFLYGDLWVDRPPLLIAVYRLADDLGGLGPLRDLAALAVAVLVVAAGWAGWRVAAGRGAVAAAVIAAALACTPLFTAPEVDGEILAAPLVMVACALGLQALLAPGGRWRQAALLGGAGFVGACAVLVKQNFTDAFAFLGVLVLCRALRAHVTWRVAVRQLLTVIGGAVIPVAGALVWAASWHSGLVGGAKALWEPLVAFRSASLDIITDQSLTAPLARAVDLFGIAVASGLFILLVGFVVLNVRAVRALEPLTVAVVVMLLAGQPAIALGGSFWPHYLIELVPGAALAGALLVSEPVGARRPFGVLMTVVVAASAAVAVPADYPTTSATGCAHGAGATTTGRWLSRAAKPGDTLVMVYAGATTVEESGLTPAYPYLWSLPLRTLDPHVSLLRARLTGPDAATWVVETLPLDSWRLDSSGRLSVTLISNYRPVAFVCGRTILLRSDLQRDVPSDES